MVEAPPRHPACSTGAGRAPHGAARDSSRDAGTSSAHHDDVEDVLPAHRNVLLFTSALVSAADRPGALRAWGDSDKLHPVTARCARRNLLRVIFCWHSPRLSRPWQDELRNLKTRPPSDVKTPVPRDRGGRADPLCPAVSHGALLGECQG